MFTSLWPPLPACSMCSKSSPNGSACFDKFAEPHNLGSSVPGSTMVFSCCLHGYSIANVLRNFVAIPPAPLPCKGRWWASGRCAGIYIAHAVDWRSGKKGSKDGVNVNNSGAAAHTSCFHVGTCEGMGFQLLGGQGHFGGLLASATSPASSVDTLDSTSLCMLTLRALVLQDLTTRNQSRYGPFARYEGLLQNRG